MKKVVSFKIYFLSTIIGGLSFDEELLEDEGGVLGFDEDSLDDELDVEVFSLVEESLS